MTDNSEGASQYDRDSQDPYEENQARTGTRGSVAQEEVDEQLSSAPSTVPPRRSSRMVEERVNRSNVTARGSDYPYTPPPKPTSTPQRAAPMREQAPRRTPSNIREDMVHNAVKFLTNPSKDIQEASEQRKVIFLRDYKYLTREEIDEAFVRSGLPMPSERSYSVPAAPARNSAPPQGQYQAPGIGPQPQIPGPLHQHRPPPETSFGWKALMATGLLCAALGSGTTLLTQNYVVPRVSKKPQKAELTEAAVELKVNQKLNQVKDDLLQEVTKAQRETLNAITAIGSQVKALEKRDDEILNISNDLKSMKMRMRDMSLQNQSSPLSSAQASSSAAPSTRQSSLPSWQYDHSKKSPHAYSTPTSLGSGKFNVNNNQTNTEASSSSSSSSSSSPSSSTPSNSNAPYPQSFSSIMEMVSKGETPPGIREINDKPPNPNAPVNRGAQTAPEKPYSRKDNGNRDNSNNPNNHNGEKKRGFN